MSPRRARTPTCVVIWWGDIPSQVMVRDEEHTLKAELPARFQHAYRCRQPLFQYFQFAIDRYS